MTSFRDDRRAGAVDVEPARGASSPEPNATILVVDDEALVRETLTDLLEADGYHVLTAASGEQVPGLLNRVDLVLLDAMLPGRDGWSVCREIKEEKDPLLPVLMVTARTSPEDVVRTFDAGADDYIAKPFNVAELSARIGTRLRAHRAERELQRANARLRELADRNYELYQQARKDAEERATLLRELDHRVRNNLSVIMGLVSMERNRNDPRPTEDTLSGLESRLRSFIIVHETFRREGYKGVPAQPVIERIVQRLRASLDPEQRVTLRVEAEPVLLDERRGFALALIVNELVSNALRHAFPGRPGGNIGVSVARESESIRTVVSDDGVGFARGAESPAVGSGRSIVDALLRGELAGSIETDTDARGTRVCIRFPFEGEPTASHQ